jgi:iron complex transport system substrate-binding protein
MPRPRNGSTRRPARAKSAKILAVFAGSAGLLVAFASRAHRADGNEGADTVVLHDSFPKLLENGTTRQELPREPMRIASLTVMGDEILTALVDPARIVAVSRFADDPWVSLCTGRAPKGAARIRGMDPERIVALEPEIVFVAHYTLDYAVRLLTGTNIPVARFRTVHSYADVEANVRLAARATGAVVRGETLIGEMNARLDDVANRVSRYPRPRVLYYSPVNYTSGRGTLVDEKIRRAGGLNVAAEFGLVGFDSVSLDVLLALNPDVIVVPRWSETSSTHDLSANPAWSSVAALRTGRVFAISASILTSEAPDGVVGVEELGRLLHPEAFSS